MIRLQDKNHNTIGYIDEDSRGNKKIYDKYHTIVGYYDKQSNKTLDKYRSTVGYGDLTVSLLDD